MDPPSSTKAQKPRRNRDWERQRRLKFNDAIAKLGEIVKSINKAKCNSGEDSNTQYPKIEIVQKAIICLTNCVQEKTQLKAEILALEVKLDTIEKQKNNRRDVSLQVTLGVNKKNQNGKAVKLVMVQNKEKEKSTNDSTKPKTEKRASTIKKPLAKPPKLLPLTNIKKENAIVMLPATPYIFPQRPVLFPQPPTFVLVDTNLQSLSKPATFPLVNKNTTDITKTTMVNILPISAYSHTLSPKSKRNVAKPRCNVSKKSTKKHKIIEKLEKIDIVKSSDVELEKKTVEKVVDGDNKIDEESSKMTSNESSDKNKKEEKTPDKPAPTNAPKINKELEASKLADNIKDPNENNQVVDHQAKCTESSTIKLQDEKTSTPDLSVPISIPNEKSVEVTSVPTPKCDKANPPKSTQEYKSKDTKIPNILDPTICETAVDGGNARLELAEEFLATSPTAAFLMSFPLVSGNRSDSPAEEVQSANTKESIHRHDSPTQQISYFEKPSSPNNKTKSNKSLNNQNDTSGNHNIVSKPSEMPKCDNNKSIGTKTTTSATNTMTSENPFLNLPLPSAVPSNCTLADATFTMDFDCSVTKSVTTPVTAYATTNSNPFYKGDSFNTVKSSIYSTSTISSGHEFNSLGLYPCAMENYSNKNKTDFSNVEDNLMKIGNSRLTYDIDLGWSHKGFDFVNCTTSGNTFHKDNILNNTATPFSTAYNPFNPEFHVPLVTNTSKKNPTSKPNTLPEQITSFYNQGTNLWSEDVSSIYTNSNVSKNFISKQQNYFPSDHLHSNMTLKTNVTKSFDVKQSNESNTEISLKPTSGTAHNIGDKYTKKSPNKMHINWMTSEIRPMQNNCNQNQPELKNANKTPYPQNEQVIKKQVQNDGNYFPINMHHFPSQSNHEELHAWPTTRPAGTTEISMEPPPINLPTLVGDLALGPHDKKRADALNRTLPHTDLQNCGNFLSVTQLMNRSNENMPLRSNGPVTETQKSITSKQNLPLNEVNRKTRLENHPQICYGFNDSKVAHPYDNTNHFTQPKVKSKLEKGSKTQKNSYSAESLIRGGTTCTQKLHDNNGAKFMMPQKFNDFTIAQDSGVAQVSHFPPILDYSENSYAGQQYSGTTLYNSTTNTISNSFYTNFMPGSTNLMTSNYTGGPFPSDFVDYNQTADCNNYPNHKYSDIKVRNNASLFPQEKESQNYKSTRRESAAKHKLECSKKESSKKYQSKRPKLNNEVDEWNDTSHVLWQNKAPNKRHQNTVPDELTFPNYMGNQMPTQYQPDFFNSHIMQTNMQNVGTNADRSLSGFPVASRANFNLSALFPEITMKVQ